MDDIFIQKVLDGDTDAFRHIIAEYKDMAYSIAMSIIKDEFYAEEIIQISFLTTFNKLSTFRGASKFSTWFFRIVINESFKCARRNKRDFVDFVDTPPEISVEADNALLHLAEADQKYFINEALKRLSPKESLVLRLFYLNESSVEEISDSTGWSGNNVKVILYRARINLKKILTDIYKLDKKELYG
jgi:RNA polymerase sigma factor (sigma-70 family)